MVVIIDEYDKPLLSTIDNKELHDKFKELDYAVLDEILTPNVKHRNASKNAAAELKGMLDSYSSAAIEENPALRNQYKLLTQQVAREAKELTNKIN